MSEYCGEPSASAKLINQLNRKNELLFEQISKATAFTTPSSQTKQAVTVDKDEGIEYFEFKEANPTGVSDATKAPSADDWREAYLKAYSRPETTTNFPNGFEEAFSRKVSISNATPSSSSFACPWSNEFFQKPASSATTPAATAAENSQWISDFMRQSEGMHTDTVMSNGTVADWVREFSSTASVAEKHDEDAIEMQSIAKSILDNLEISDDPKLANSRFVAYLRELAKSSEVGSTKSELFNHPKFTPHTGSSFEKCPVMTIGSSTASNTNQADFQQWKESYLRNIAPLVTTEDQTAWQQLQKMWEEYEATGLGYQNFARREFSNYQFSLPIAANPYAHLNDLQLKEIVENTRRDLRDRILAAEVRVHRHQNDGMAWQSLAHLQQANEMDVQAISAFLKATTFNPYDVETWVGLAASCANESCIPDAFDAIRRIAESAKGDTDCSRQYRLASAILNSLNGEPGKAITILQEQIQHRISDTDWSLRNRLAATLANARRYQEALPIYAQLLNEGYDYPRIHYNQGIALMCLDRYEEAARSFVRAIERQLPVDVVEGVRDELLPSYKAPWEALKVNFTLWEQDQVSVDVTSLNDIKRFLRM